MRRYCHRLLSLARGKVNGPLCVAHRAHTRLGYAFALASLDTLSREQSLIIARDEVIA